MLGAQIPRRTQPSSSDSTRGAANAQQLLMRRQRNEVAADTPSPPSLHTHRPPRISADKAQTEAVAETGADGAAVLPSPRHLVDGVPYLLRAIYMV